MCKSVYHLCLYLTIIGIWQSNVQIKNRAPPQPPKKVLTPFFLYRNDVFQEVRRENPDLKVTDIAIIISQLWNNLQRQKKEIYEEQYQKSKEKYNLERQAYEKLYGPAHYKRRRRRHKE